MASVCVVRSCTQWRYVQSSGVPRTLPLHNFLGTCIKQVHQILSTTKWYTGFKSTVIYTRDEKKVSVTYFGGWNPALLRTGIFINCQNNTDRQCPVWNWTECKSEFFSLFLYVFVSLCVCPCLSPSVHVHSVFVFRWTYRFNTEAAFIFSQGTLKNGKSQSELTTILTVSDQKTANNRKIYT